MNCTLSYTQGGFDTKDRQKFGSNDKWKTKTTRICTLREGSEGTSIPPVHWLHVMRVRTWYFCKVYGSRQRKGVIDDWRILTFLVLLFLRWFIFFNLKELLCTFRRTVSPSEVHWSALTLYSKATEFGDSKTSEKQLRPFIRSFTWKFDFGV